MKGTPAFATAVCGVAALLTSPALAATATNLGSFEGIEEPTMIYRPSSGSFTRGDTYPNITNPSAGTFRFLLRFSSSAWDGDGSNTTNSNTDRQRAEVKGLGVHQKNNETFDYTETWKTSRAGSGSFWHVFQLKATDGDKGAPLVTNSIRSGSTASVRIWSGSATGSSSIRDYGYSVNNFTETRIRIKVATSSTGEIRVSVNGDALSGRTGISCHRPGATDYRPKWGSYRGVGTSSPYGNDTVEIHNITANKVTSGSPTPTSTPTPAPRSTATPTPTPGGGGGTFSGYYRILGQESGRALVVQSASTANSAAVVLYDYNDNSGDNDEWQLLSISSGYYRIIARHSGKDMVVQGASTANGARVIQYTYGGANTNDEWTLVDAGSGLYEIRNRMSGKNVQAMGTANSSAVGQQSDNNAGNQRWQLVSIP